MAKRPAFQFYPGDWRRDSALQQCSVAARGLWIEMICIMHDGSPYGHLKTGHAPIRPPALARMVGASTHEVEAWLEELYEAGVCSVLGDGCIISRRMIRDEELRNLRAGFGELSKNNPNVPKKKGRKDTHKDTHKDTLPPSLPPSFDVSLGGSPSSSSASSSALAVASSTALAEQEPRSRELPVAQMVISTTYPAHANGEDF